MCQGPLASLTRLESKDILETMRQTAALMVLGVLLGGFSEIGYARPRVAVVAVEEGEGYRTRAWVAVALREALSREHQVVDPALVFHAQLGPPLAEITKAKARLKAAIGLYDGLSFKKATAAFKEAVELNQRVVLKGGPSDDYIKALHYWGASALYATDREAAIRHFKSAIAYAPRARPDPNIFSPDVVKAYDDAAKSPSDGALRILCSPAAEVTVNGEAKGITPLELVGLRPGSHLVRLRRAGYEADAQWIAVSARSAAEVRSELKAVPRLPAFRQTLKKAGSEVKLTRPGEAVERLTRMLSAESVVIVAGDEAAIRMLWGSGGRWIRRHRGKVIPGGEREFASTLLSAEVAVAPVAGCEDDEDCASNETCADGRCVERVAGATPIYKKWWFWTIVGAVVVGGTVGIIAGTQGGTEDWRAVVKPGGME
jgi:hypothetical protein